MPTTNRWYLLWDNVERGAFYRAGVGYTLDVTAAARFPEEVARRMVRRSNIAVPPGSPPEAIMMLEPTGRVPAPMGPTDLLRAAFHAAKADEQPLRGIIYLADQLGVDLGPGFPNPRMDQVRELVSAFAAQQAAAGEPACCSEFASTGHAHTEACCTVDDAPPAGRPGGDDAVRLARALLEIAEMAMPDMYVASDSRCVMARDVLARAAD